MYLIFHESGTCQNVKANQPTKTTTTEQVLLHKQAREMLG